MPRIRVGAGRRGAARSHIAQTPTTIFNPQRASGGRSKSGGMSGIAKLRQRHLQFRLHARPSPITARSRRPDVGSVTSLFDGLRSLQGVLNQTVAPPSDSQHPSPHPIQPNSRSAHWTDGPGGTMPTAYIPPPLAGCELHWPSLACCCCCCCSPILGQWQQNRAWARASTYVM